MPVATDLNTIVKDSAYAAIGFGVLGFQKAQVRRRELIEQLSAQGGNMAQLGQQLENISAEVGNQLNSLGEQLGAQLSGLRSSAGGAPVDTARTQLVEVAKLVDRQVSPVRQQLDGAIVEFTDHLPEPTRGLVLSLRSAAQSQEAAVRSAIGLD